VTITEAMQVCKIFNLYHLFAVAYAQSSWLCIASATAKPLTPQLSQASSFIVWGLKSPIPG
jgi:hypothetical protein